MPPLFFFLQPFAVLLYEMCLCQYATCFGFDTVFLLVGLDLTRKSAKVGLDLLRFSSDFGLDLNKDGFLNLKSMVY